MIEFDSLKNDILSRYAAIAYLPLRLEAMEHTLGVIHAISLLHTDTDLTERRTAALLHDTGRFLFNQADHARASAAYALELGLPEPVVSAIAVHSKKERIDSLLAEDLKDADVIARWLADPAYEHPRLTAALARLQQ